MVRGVGDADREAGCPWPAMHGRVAEAFHLDFAEDEHDAS